ncbi:MAG: TolB family protein [Armatimonadota bacterium]
MRTVYFVVFTMLAIILCAGCGGEAGLPLSPAASEYIAFVSDRDGATEIYVMNADGSDQRRLTHDSGRKDEISISPDGSRIAFVSKITGLWHVYTVNLDGSGLQQLTDNGRNNWRPSFSLDGSKLVFFSSIGGGNDEIYVMNADGTGQTRLTDNPAMDVLPVFTPDGEKIVFCSSRSGIYQLYDMDPDGSDQRQITDDADMALYFDISPNGSRIAATCGGVFVSPGSGGMYAYIDGGRIATIDMNGGDLRVLTDTNSDNDKPVYNPAGNKIAFSSNRDGQWEIYVMNADGSGQTCLTNHSASDTFPAWGPAYP